MKKSVKILLCVAAGCIILGSILFVSAASSVGFDFWNAEYGADSAKSAVVEYTQVTHTVTERFDSIRITEAACDVQILPGEDGVCRVTVWDGGDTVHTVQTEGNTLVIQEEQKKTHWYMRMNLFWSSESKDDVIVYLPEKDYERITVSLASGDLSVDEGLSFHDAEISSASGTITVCAAVTGTLQVNTASGDVILSSDGEPCGSVEVGTASGDVSISGINAFVLDADTTSGEIEIADVSAGDISAETASGDISFVRVTAEGDMEFDTTSGDVLFEEIGATEISAETTSGDVRGSVLGEMVFVAGSTSGNIRVPYPVLEAEGVFEISTTSGDVNITNKE